MDPTGPDVTTATPPALATPDLAPMLTLWDAVLHRGHDLPSLFREAVRVPVPVLDAAASTAEVLAGLALGAPKPSTDQRVEFFELVHEGMPRWSPFPSTRAARLFVVVRAGGPGSVSEHNWSALGARHKISGAVRGVRTLGAEVIDRNGYEDETALLVALRALSAT